MTESTKQYIFTTLWFDSIYLQIFQVYVNYINLVINLFIPTLVLGVLNCLVYRSLKNSTTIGNQLRRSGRGEEALRKRDIRLTRIAIAIVGVFIACHLPRFIPNIVEMVTSMPQVKKVSFYFQWKIEKKVLRYFYLILIFIHVCLFCFSVVCHHHQCQ